MSEEAPEADERPRVVAAVSLALVFGLLAGILTELFAGEWTVLSSLAEHERSQQDVSLSFRVLECLPGVRWLPGPWGIERPLALLATVAACLGTAWLVETGRARAQLRVLGAAGALVAALMALAIIAPGREPAHAAVPVGTTFLVLALGAFVLLRLSRRGPPEGTGGRSLRWAWLAALVLVTPGLIDAFRTYRPQAHGPFEIRFQVGGGENLFFLQRVTERDVRRLEVLRNAVRLSIRAELADRVIAARRSYGVVQIRDREGALLGVIDHTAFDGRGRCTLTVENCYAVISSMGVRRR